MRKRTIGLALCVVLAGLWLHADDKPSADDRVKDLEERVRAAEFELKKAKELLSAIRSTSNTTKSLEGVWRIVSIDGNRPGGTFVKPPYDEYKIMTAGHYLWLSFDPGTGKVLRSGGGTYTLDGEDYTAHVDYSNAEDLRGVAGQEYKGKCRLDGKRWYHYGHMTNGAVFDELWERVH
jgi:hypothetical protein